MSDETRAPGTLATAESEPTPEAAAVAATEGEGQPVAAAATSPTPPDVRTLLAQTDAATLKEIAKEHPGLREIIESRAGRRLDEERPRIAARVEAQIRAEIEQKALEERLETMSDEDLGQFVRENRRTRAVQAQVEAAAEARIHKDLQDALLGDLPPQVQFDFQAQIAAGKIGGYPELRKALAQYEREQERATATADLEKRIAEAVAEAKQQWEQEMRATNRQSAPRPDLGMANAPPASSTRHFSSYEEAARAHALGEITNQEMRAVKRQFRIE